MTVLFAFTREAADAVGGSQKIKERVDNGLRLLNGALKNSATGVQVHAVAKFVEVTGVAKPTTNAKVGEMLREVTDVNGRFSGVHQARADLRADMVCLIFDGHAMGQANLGKPPADRMAPRAIMVTQHGTFGESYIFPHEFGHVLGCAHQGEEGGMAPYARGYSPISIAGALNNPWRTVTANGGVSLPYFSANRQVTQRYQKPDASHADATVQVGTPQNDCARAIRESGPAYARLGDHLTRPANNAAAYATRLVTPNETSALKAPAITVHGVRIDDGGSFTYSTEDAVQVGVALIGAGGHPGFVTGGVGLATGANQTKAMGLSPLEKGDRLEVWFLPPGFRGGYAEWASAPGAKKLGSSPPHP